MKLRDAIISDIYDTMVNEKLDYGLGDDLYDKLLNNLGIMNDYGKECDLVMDALVTVEHAAFFAGANMILDFISGKEVKA